MSKASSVPASELPQEGHGTELPGARYELEAVANGYVLTILENPTSMGIRMVFGDLEGVFEEIRASREAAA